MRFAILTRCDSTDHGTFGMLTTDSGFTCYTGELPWRDNKLNKSCIPEGRYDCVWLPSEKFGECYHLTNVPSRTGIEIHAANYMGDSDLGYRCDMAGCIALGKAVYSSSLQGDQKSLLSSRKTLEEFEQEMNHLEFELVIKNSF